MPFRNVHQVHIQIVEMNVIQLERALLQRDVAMEQLPMAIQRLDQVIVNALRQILRIQRPGQRRWILARLGIKPIALQRPGKRGCQRAFHIQETSH